MIVFLNIAIIALLLWIFYQDIKERKVLLISMITLLFVGGLLHSQYQFFELFLLQIGINIGVVGVVLMLLWLYTHFVMRKRLFEAFGLGDLLFFIIIAVSFPTPTFLVVFCCSLLFSLVLFIALKTSLKENTIPLAGFQALFIVLLLVSNLLFNFVDLYRI